jgi:hypothetical protein
MGKKKYTKQDLAVKLLDEFKVETKNGKYGTKDEFSIKKFLDDISKSYDGLNKLLNFKG